MTSSATPRGQQPAIIRAHITAVTQFYEYAGADTIPTRPTPQQRITLIAPSGVATRTVSPTGVVPLHGCSIIIGRRWAGSTATLLWQGDLVTILINNEVIHKLTLDRSVRYQRLDTRTTTGTPLEP